MTEFLPVRGTELRYLLTTYLFDHGPATVDELVEALRYQGFDTAGRATEYRIDQRVKALRAIVAVMSLGGGQLECPAAACPPRRESA